MQITYALHRLISVSLDDIRIVHESADFTAQEIPSYQYSDIHAASSACVRITVPFSRCSGPTFGDPDSFF